jgi:hypothetical protein
VSPSWRKPVGAFVIIGLIVLWAVLVASLSGWVGDWPVLVQGVFYLVTGLIWIAPLRPLIRWIETGRWAGPPGRG